jgi:hypothetical protein
MDKLEIKRALLYNKPSILDSRSGGNQCFSGPNLFLPDLSVGLLTCDILEVCDRFYWPGPSGLWLTSKTETDCLLQVTINSI